MDGIKVAGKAAEKTGYSANLRESKQKWWAIPCGILLIKLKAAALSEAGNRANAQVKSEML